MDEFIWNTSKAFLCFKNKIDTLQLNIQIVIKKLRKISNNSNKFPFIKINILKFKNLFFNVNFNK